MFEEHFIGVTFDPEVTLILIDKSFTYSEHIPVKFHDVRVWANVGFLRWRCL